MTPSRAPISITGGEWLLPPKETWVCRQVRDDSRQLVAGDLFVAVKGELTDGQKYILQAAGAGAAAICGDRKPAAGELRDLAALGTGFLLVPDALKALHALAADHRHRLAHVPLVAVTGSSGKTSIRCMIQAVLEEVYPGGVVGTEGNTNNHFGVPRNVFRLGAATQASVLELGTNHPGEIAALAAIVQPSVAVVGNVGKAHIEFFGTQDAIAREKGSVFRALPPGGRAVMPVAGPGNPILRSCAAERRITTFGPGGSGADVEYACDVHPVGGSHVELLWRGESMRHGFDWALSGRHQAANAAAAAAACAALDIPMATIVCGLRKTVLPGMRMRIEQRNGICWCNDAYNSNPESALASLEWFTETGAGWQGNLFVVLGDMLELGPEHALPEHTRLLETALEMFPDGCVIGVGGEMCRAAKPPVVTFADAAGAAAWARRRVQAGDRVLLKGSRGIGLEALVPAE